MLLIYCCLISIVPQEPIFAIANRTLLVSFESFLDCLASSTVMDHDVKEDGAIVQVLLRADAAPLDQVRASIAKLEELTKDNQHALRLVSLGI